MKPTKHALSKFYSFLLKKDKIQKNILFVDLEELFSQSFSNAVPIKRIKCVNSILDNNFKQVFYKWDKTTNVIFVHDKQDIITCYGRSTSKNFVG